MRGIEQFLQVDAATLGALKYAGTWNASTNTPTLASGVGVQGQYYVVSVAGSTNLDGETNWGVGDWAVFNGSVWQKVDGGSTGLLTTLTVTGNTYLATTSGDVGIGTSSPVAKLTVSGTAGNGNGLMSVDGSDFVRIFADSSFGSAINWSTGDSLRFATSDSSFGSFTECVRITSAGDVGIGTSSPASKLHVVGDIQQDNANYIKGKLAAGTATRLFGLNAANSLYIGGIDASQSETLFVRGGTTQMTLDTSGNLGLGVTPSAWDRPAYQSTQNLAVLGLANTSNLAQNAYFNASWKYMTSAAAADFQVSQGAFYWFTAPPGTAGNAIPFTQDMTLNSTGLGIGTTSPATKLHVNTGAAGYGITVAANTQTSITYQIGIDSSSNLAIYDSFAAAKRLVLDTSGNLGLGITPSAWVANSKALQIGNFVSLWQGSNGATQLGFGVYEGGINTYNYSTTGDFPTMYRQLTGAHIWYNAPSGTAGNAISFTQAMTLDASGNLGIGTTSEPFARGYSKWLAVSGSTTAAIEINAATGNIAYFDMGVNGTRSFSIINDGVAPSIAAVGALPLLFSTNSVERARIDSSGNWMAGTTTAIGRATVVGGSSQLSFHDGNGSNTNYGYLNYGGSSGELTLNANSTGGNTAIRFLTSNGGANAERVRIDYAGSLGLGGSSFGSGALVMFIANATTAPTTNPTGGGVLYVEAGALKYRGSSGTVTTIANA